MSTAHVPVAAGDLSPCPRCGATHLRLYTIPEVAELFGVSVGWVYGEIREGRIAVTDLYNGKDRSVGGNRPKAKWRISTPEVVRVINERTAGL